MKSMLTAEMLLREIYLAETELRWFEQKYGLLSETFYQLYEQGQLRDEDPAEIQTYLEWSGWWEVYQNRRRRYAKAVADNIPDNITGSVAPIYHLHEYAEDLGVTDLAQNIDVHLGYRNYNRAESIIDWV